MCICLVLHEPQGSGRAAVHWNRRARGAGLRSLHLAWGRDAITRFEVGQLFSGVRIAVASSDSTNRFLGVARSRDDPVLPRPARDSTPERPFCVQIVCEMARIGQDFAPRYPPAAKRSERMPNSKYNQVGDTSVSPLGAGPGFTTYTSGSAPRQASPPACFRVAPGRPRRPRRPGHWRPRAPWRVAGVGATRCVDRRWGASRLRRLAPRGHHVRAGRAHEASVQGFAVLVCEGAGSG